jgi:hypothetical protein
MPARDWRKLYQQYRGQWVALKHDEETVLASGRSLKEVAEKAKALGYAKPILTRMPDDLSYFVG